MKRLWQFNWRSAPGSLCSWLLVVFFAGLWLPACLPAQAPQPKAIQILDGQPTRLFMTGNPHHPTFGQEQLSKLLDRYFTGKSPVVVAGLADARKDPATGKPIPPAKIGELMRFLEPEFARRAERPKSPERLVILNYVIVNAPRDDTESNWINPTADALQAYAQAALDRGAGLVFFSEMVQPNHISGGKFGNQFRRAGLAAFDELAARKLPGIKRGPALQVQMEQHRHFFRDDRHYSDAGRDFIACLWLEAMLKHDGRPLPEWLKAEIQSLLSADTPPAASPDEASRS